MIGTVVTVTLHVEAARSRQTTESSLSNIGREDYPEGNILPKQSLESLVASLLLGLLNSTERSAVELHRPQALGGGGGMGMSHSAVCMRRVDAYVGFS